METETEDTDDNAPDEEEATGEGGDGEEAEADGTGTDGTPDADAAAAQLAQELADATARADTAEAALRATRIRLAADHLNHGRAEPFKDLDLALSQVDLGALVVKDDGTVTGLDAALDHIASRYPYLVDDSGEASDPDDGEDKPQNRSANRQKRTSRETTEATLAKQFPAMRRR
jgi:hypothetical protein